MMLRSVFFLLVVGAIELTTAEVPDSYNHCTMCPGTSYLPNPNKVVLNGKTCEGLYYEALFNDLTDEICHSKYLFIGSTKCECLPPKAPLPPPNCSLCMDGSEPPEELNFVVIDGLTGLTCEQADTFLNNVQQTDDSCESFHLKGIERCGCPDMVPSLAPSVFPSSPPSSQPSSNPVTQSFIATSSEEQDQIVKVEKNGWNYYITAGSAAGTILIFALAAIRYNKSRRNKAEKNAPQANSEQSEDMFPMSINRQRDHIIMIDAEQVELRASPSMVTRDPHADLSYLYNEPLPFDEQNQHRPIAVRRYPSYESEDTINL